jgi:hypothetical protein
MFAVAPNCLLAELALHLHGEAQRLFSAVEERQDAVPGYVGHLSAVVADQRREQPD